MIERICAVLARDLLVLALCIDNMADAWLNPLSGGRTGA